MATSHRNEFESQENNGKLKFPIEIFKIVLYALIAYFTAQSAINTKLAVIEERESNHWAEVKTHWMEVKEGLDELKGENEALRQQLQHHSETTAQSDKQLKEMMK